ncbi:AIR carboxylase family protein [Weissella confusa]|uniref:AIR carboxylase family protein n=1 Tax=Weissella confusa TaxID=1583 RepID=A0A923NI65_WEICO|nr:AIR carboxylase family protein [Weissella confusa]
MLSITNQTLATQLETFREQQAQKARESGQFEVTVETHIISAHRMPTEIATYAANAREAGVDVIIAGAGGAAHLPGMVAAQTTLPVIGVPMKTKVKRLNTNIYFSFVLLCE